MAGLLYHSTGHIIGRLLINLGQATLFSADQPWPMYVGVEPSSPDNCITLYSTAGILGGNHMLGSDQQQERHGFQVRVRSSNPEQGYIKARAIAYALDQVSMATVTIITGVTVYTYLIHNIVRTTDVIGIGLERPASSRNINVVNGLAHIRKRS